MIWSNRRGQAATALLGVVLAATTGAGAQRAGQAKVTTPPSSLR